jgi:predicted outer membrane protein
VRRFAELVSTQHTRAQRHLARLADALGLRFTDSAASARLAVRVEELAATLRAIESAEFDATYLAIQAEQAVDVLGFVNDKLLPMASAPQIEAELVEMRQLLEHHVRVAGELAAARSEPQSQ